MSQYIYDYYDITLPGDLFTDIEDYYDYAIVTARDNAALYVVPCEWSVLYYVGEIGDHEIMFKVRRKRRYGPKTTGNE